MRSRHADAPYSSLSARRSYLELHKQGKPVMLPAQRSPWGEHFVNSRSATRESSSNAYVSCHQSAPRVSRIYILGSGDGSVTARCRHTPNWRPLRLCTASALTTRMLLVLWCGSRAGSAAGQLGTRHRRRDCHSRYSILVCPRCCRSSPLCSCAPAYHQHRTCATPTQSWHQQ